MTKYTSPAIQNEIMKVMDLQVLQQVSADLGTPPFLTVMAHEATNSSDQEQVTLILRWVAQELEVHEEFLDLYHVAFIDATT